MAAVTVKRKLRRNIEFLVFEENGDEIIFHEFVAHVIKVGFLVRGDIFVVDNCSIHMKEEHDHNKDLSQIISITILSIIILMMINNIRQKNRNITK